MAKRKVVAVEGDTTADTVVVRKPRQKRKLTMPQTLAERASFEKTLATIREEIMARVASVTSPDYMSKQEALSFIAALREDLGTFGSDQASNVEPAV